MQIIYSLSDNKAWMREVCGFGLSCYRAFWPSWKCRTCTDMSFTIYVSSETKQGYLNAQFTEKVAKFCPQSCRRIYTSHSSAREINFPISVDIQLAGIKSSQTAMMVDVLHIKQRLNTNELHDDSFLYWCFDRLRCK